MRRSSRCRWILPFSIFPSFFFLLPRLESEFNSKSIFVRILPSSIPNHLFDSPLIYRIFQWITYKWTQRLAFRKSVQRIEEKWVEGREKKGFDYRRKRRISTLSRSRSSDLGIIDINKMYEDVWNLRQHTLMSTVERFIVSSVAR